MRLSWVLYCVPVFLLCVSACAAPQSATDQDVMKKEQGRQQTGTHDELSERWLDRIEAKASNVKTLTAQLRYDRIQGLVGDRQRRFGALVYESGPPGRFAVHFDRVLVDERLDLQDRRYIFDGWWLVERHEDQKLFIKRQVAAPGGEVADPLALGQGPIPIPINAKKDRVLKRFDVKVIEPVDSDPVDSVHLRLTPKTGAGSEYDVVDLWYGRQKLLPVRVRTVDDSENESVIDVSDVEVNGPVDQSLLDTSEPSGPGWRVEVTPWEKGP